MELIALIAGILGNVSSTIMFIAPMVTFVKMIRKRDTESFSPMPYVMSFLCQALWTYYGAIDPKGFLILCISVIGVVFEGVYLVIFIVLANHTRRMYAVKLILISIATFVTLFLTTFFGSSGVKRMSIVGFLAAINSICMFAAPLTVMKMVIQTKSVEYMPFFLSLSVFINGGTWTTWAVLMKDLFVAVPAGIGFLLGAIQLTLYSLYFNHKSIQLKDTKCGLETTTVVPGDQKPPKPELEQNKLKTANDEHFKHLETIL